MKMRESTYLSVFFLIRKFNVTIDGTNNLILRSVYDVT